MKRIPFLRPNLVRRDSYAEYLDQIDETRVYSNYGPLNSQFEDRLRHAFFAGRGHLSTVANATLGLVLSFALSRRDAGKYVVMPSFTFAATAQAALWCGLTPYFVDIDGETWCMDAAALRRTVHKLGSEVALVVPYAAFGSAIDLVPYAELHESGIPVVVDAAASLGTIEGESHFGTGFPGMIVFSLHATKAFPVGEGGVVYSSDHLMIAKLRQAANFGFSSARESVLLGLNAKLSELHAAVALATLEDFASKKAVRQQVYHWYENLFHQRNLVTNEWQLQKVSGSVAHQFVSALCPPHVDNLALVATLDRVGIETRTYFRPGCHQHALFLSCPHSSMAVTEAVASRIISLPLWEEMTREHVEYIVTTLSQSGNRA